MKGGDEIQSWKINFSYESHKNVKDLRAMVGTLIDCVKENTNAARLNHPDNPLYHNSKATKSLPK